MALTLTVRSVERQGATAPPPLHLDRRGAVIGRAPGLDWTLPDERNTVSSRHCEIAYRDGAYLIADTSTNGTSANGRRLAAPHRLDDGDVLAIGPYTVVATITPDGMALPQTSARQAAAASPLAPPTTAPPQSAGSPAEHLLRNAGLRRGDVAGSDAEILGRAGTLLREMAGGTAMLLERRVRARSELGIAAAPAAAANPLEKQGALAQLLATPTPERAAGQAFADLEIHQLAALKAMQGAMKATLDTFAPAKIRTRAGAKADDAALWREYERAFAGSGDGFADLFAREFRSAYEALAKRAAG